MSNKFGNYEREDEKYITNSSLSKKINIYRIIWKESPKKNGIKPIKGARILQNTILGFYQKEAVNMGLDLTDLLLLRWFVNFTESETMISMCIDSKKFYWVNYSKVAANYPVLNLKKDAIYRHFKKLADKGILDRYTLKKGGSYSFYSIGKNYEKLPMDLDWEGY